MEPVVIDNGSFSCKAGYANPDNGPQVVMPTLVRDAAEGPTAPPRCPIHRGLIEGWEEMEGIWHHMLYDQLGWVVGEEGGVLVTEPLLTPKAARERLTQIMFERFNVSGLYIAEQGVVALYALGKISGVSVSVGHGCVDIAPVWEGAGVHSASVRLPFGSSDVDALIEKLVTEKCAREGVAPPAPAATLMDSPWRAIKELACRTVPSKTEYEALVPPTIWRTPPAATSAPASSSLGDASAWVEDDKASVVHVLPDGKSFRVPRSTALSAGEALFRPSLLLGLPGSLVPPGGTHGLSDALYAAILACSLESRRHLFENVALWGGGALTPGARERLRSDLDELTPPSLSPSLVAPPDYMPEETTACASWLGGAVLAKVAFPQSHAISKFEYDEAGPAIAHRKCF
eukprot:jgi/Mesvir1/23907/Mv10687-RA.1